MNDFSRFGLAGLVCAGLALAAAGCDPNAANPFLRPTGSPPPPPGSGPSLTIDGTAEAEYGNALAVQAVQTQFGDATSGQPGSANGSELDGAFAAIVDSTLYLVLAGNLESNFNKLEIFIDSHPGGQNVLRGDNPDVDGNGLNRMQGLTFDAGFESDYYLMVTGGNTPYQLFANFAETPTGGGGTGGFIGQGTAVSDGTLTGGTLNSGIRITIDNSNVAGVGPGTAAASGAGVRTGVEMAIPLRTIGNPTGAIKIVAFINGTGHDFLANQVLGPLTPPQANLGNPAGVNFANLAGEQFFTVPAPAERPTLAGGGR